MLSSGRPDQTAEDDVVIDAKPACVALVPLVTTAQWSPIPSQPRSDPTFVAHLIATAEHVPQTRSLRRASAADAQSAYSAHQPPVSGNRTRQTI